MSKKCFQRSIVLLTTLVLFATGCATAPFDYPREANVAVNAAEDTTLRREVEEWRATNPGPSGFYPLVAGQDAFAASSGSGHTGTIPAR
jgi:hypothetical protein